jgi:hypothetical protein
VLPPNSRQSTRPVDVNFVIFDYSESTITSFSRKSMSRTRSVSARQKQPKTAQPPPPTWTLSISWPTNAVASSMTCEAVPWV